MRPLIFGLTASFLFSAPVCAGNRNPADYPLRVHVFTINRRSHFERGVQTFVEGEGRANLFENGEAHAFDFSFRCDQQLMYSPGYETYLARWKRAGKELEILLPVMGRPGVASACVLKVAMKETAYFRRNGGALDEEPAAAFKEWMLKHEYDPEHGKNQPVNPAPAAAAPAVPPNASH